MRENRDSPEDSFLHIIGSMQCIAGGLLLSLTLSAYHRTIVPYANSTQ